MKTKKLAIIGTVGLPANYGGFETLAEHLVEDLGDRYDMTVYCSTRKYKKEDRLKEYKKARLVWLPLQANGIQSILYDTLSILHALFYADVLLVLGVSGGFLLPFVRLFTNKKIITSIDGIEWKRNKWAKAARLFLWTAEWMAVKFSHANIADNEAIQDYTAIRYKTRSSIIEYGADHTLKVPATIAYKEKYPFLKKPYAFKVCRIEPENNVDMVLQAFSTLPQHTLVIVGNWNNSEYSRDLRKQFSDFGNILLLDAIYNQEELDVLRGNCFVYIHGHSAGGTNPSLVEAMYLGLPVIAFGVMYNRATTESKALYFRNRAELIRIVQDTKLAQFKQLGAAMKEIANRRYTWAIIAGKYDFLIQHTFSARNRNSLSPQLADKLDKDSLLKYELGHFQSTSFFYEKR